MKPILSLSTVYVKVPVGSGTITPTSDPVYMAFGSKPAAAAPSTGWNTASWQTVGGVNYAICLIGPGGVQLGVGSYAVYVQVTDNPEVPVLAAGTVNIV